MYCGDHILAANKPVCIAKITFYSPRLMLTGTFVELDKGHWV